MSNCTLHLNSEAVSVANVLDYMKQECKAHEDSSRMSEWSQNTYSWQEHRSQQTAVAVPYRYQFKESFDVEVSLVQNKEK
jgi:hypothetical protein